jgi:cytochrome c biogenesis protein CcmG, thiol:disulfide interchange protein DsbE
VNRKVLVAGLVLVLPLVAVLFMMLGRDPHIVKSPLVGRAAPPFSLPALGGAQGLSLQDLRGRPAVINFWATWCAPCVQEHPVLVRGAAERKDVQFVGIVFDDKPDAVQRFLRMRGSAYPNLLDESGSVAIAYGIQGVPETFFLNAEGTVVAKYGLPLDERTLDHYLALASAPPSAPAAGSGR